MDHFKDSYYSDISDNDILTHVLNIILSDTQTSIKIHSKILYFIELFTELSKNKERPHINYIIYSINYIEKYTNSFNTKEEIQNGFNIFCTFLREIKNKNIKEEIKYMFLMCYCQSKWQLFYGKNIVYLKPKYAIKESLGINHWKVFLEAFENYDYKYIH